MKATIEHSFCPYCDEVTELYFRIINTILSQPMKRNCVPAWNAYKKNTPWWLFVFGYGKHHLWVCQRRPSNTKKDFRASGNHGRILMIQAGRNGIIFLFLPRRIPFFYIYLSLFGCAISFCKKQPFVKSSVRFSEKQGSFLFPFCPLFFLPDGNMAVPRYPVPPFVATSLIFPSAVPQPVVSSVFCL